VPSSGIDAAELRNVLKILNKKSTAKQLLNRALKGLTLKLFDGIQQVEAALFVDRFYSVEVRRDRFESDTVGSPMPGRPSRAKHRVAQKGHLLSGISNIRKACRSYFGHPLAGLTRADPIAGAGSSAQELPARGGHPAAGGGDAVDLGGAVGEG
jgi:hypothetical protein